MSSPLANCPLLDLFNDSITQLNIDSLSCNEFQPEQNHHHEVLLLVGDIYSQRHHYQAMVIQQGMVAAIGSEPQMQGYLQEHNLTCNQTLRLSAAKCIVPGFIQAELDLGTALATSSWFHLGPFGLQGNWQQPMPNYNLHYLSRALSYIDKSLDADEWLLGFGVDLSLLPFSPFLPHSESKEPLSLEFLDSLQLPRPVCIFDKTAERAFINSLATMTLYLTLPDEAKRRFANVRIFSQYIEQQGGLNKDEFAWILHALPQEQILKATHQTEGALKNIIIQALSQGVTTLAVSQARQTHPLHNKVLALFHRMAKTIAKQRGNRVHAIRVLNHKAQPQSADVVYAHPDSLSLDGYLQMRSQPFSKILPLRQMITDNKFVVFASQFPERPLGALRHFDSAVNREMHTAPGYYVGAERHLLPEQRIEMRDALACVTENPAQLIDSPHQLGVLKVGAAADFVVLSHNIFANPDLLKECLVEQTWVAGQCSYSLGEDC